jgi:hypothetical protein
MLGVPGLTRMNRPEQTGKVSPSVSSTFPPAPSPTLPILHSLTLAQVCKMNSTGPPCPPPTSLPLYSAAELNVTPAVWHPALKYSQPPPMAINARHIKSQFVSQAPHMVPLSGFQPLYHENVVLWPTLGEGMHEYVGKHEAAMMPGYYYSLPSTGHYVYSAYSPYAHMQPSAYPLPFYAQPYPTILYSCPINTLPATRPTPHIPYTPLSSNPSWGTAASQFKLFDTQYERGHVGSANETEAFTPFQPPPVPLEVNVHAPEPYVPLSPVSSVLEHLLVASQVVPDAPTPATASPHLTTFVAESGHQENEDPAPVIIMEPSIDISPTLEQSQAQTAERLTQACMFCRGRKVCFSIPPSGAYILTIAMHR